MVDAIQRLFAHAAWADDLVLRALDAAGDRAPSRAVEICAHVLGAELVWLARLEGTAADTAVWPEVTPGNLERLARTCRERYAKLLEGLDEAGAARNVHYVNSAGRAFTSRVDDILLHVALHGVNHRGQVSILLRQAGLEPVPTDYIAWVRGAAAATRR
jgi:uncharacterized damage-inducible protein DinB